MSPSIPTLNASSRIMYLEAQNRGIACTTFGDFETILMEWNHNQWYTRGSRTSYQSSVGKTIADKKSLTKKILFHFQIPTARGVVVRTQKELSRLEELTYPVVMKPIDGRHGKGVVVGLSSSRTAKDRYLSAPEPMLFEEMLQGVEYRIICIDYHFTAAVFRKPAHVLGDGHLTIEELVAQKNQHPWRGEGHTNNLSTIILGESVDDLLKEQGFQRKTVVPKNQEVLLCRTANLSTGGEAWDITDTVCTENRQLFEKIARVCDLNVIGIDIMCQNLTSPIVEQAHAGVIEINASPGLRAHHFPIQGTPRNIAGSILDMVLTRI